jgi:hypothetical protein
MAHLSQSECQAFLRRELQSERLLEIDDHLSECGACRKMLENGPEAVRLLRNMESTFAGPHLDFEQLQMLVDGGPVPAEVTDHVAACRHCMAELAELKWFAADIAALPRAPKPRPQLVPAKAPVVPERPWEIRPGWYGLVAAMLLVGVVGLVVHHRMAAGNSSYEVASLRDGGADLFVDRAGDLHGDEGVPNAYREMVRVAMLNGQLQTAPAATFGGSQRETLLGAPRDRSVLSKLSFDLLSPVGRVVVDNPPLFKWQAMPGALSYRVMVYGAGYEKIVESPAVHGTEWRPAAALPAGEVYTWTVTAESANGSVREPAPPKAEAAFRTMAAEFASALTDAKARHGNDSLLLAVLYARVGAVEEAREAVDKLAAENPNSELVTRLRASLVQAPSPIKSNAAQ